MKLNELYDSKFPFAMEQNRISCMSRYKLFTKKYFCDKKIIDSQVLGSWFKKYSN